MRNATGGFSCAGEAPTEGEVGPGELGGRLEGRPVATLAQSRGCSELGRGLWADDQSREGFAEEKGQGF